MTFSPRSARAALPVLLAALVGGLLTAFELSTRSLWIDEGATVGIASQHGAALWHAIAHDGGNMLAYYLLLHVIIAAFGDATAVIRLPSVLATAATAGLTAGLAARLFDDRRVAVAAGLLTAVSLPLVFWGQDARGYAAMVTFSALAFLALQTVLDRPDDAPPPYAAAALYGAATLVALYIGFDAVLLVPAQLALLVGARHRLRLVLGVLVIVALACVPLVVLAVERGSSQLFWVPALSGTVLVQALITVLSVGLPPNFHHHVEAPTAALTLLVLGYGALVALRARRLSSGARLLLAWILIPSAIGVLAAALGEPIELSRTAILLIPAFALALARCSVGAGVPRAAGLLACAALLALRAIVLAPSYGVSPENWKAATRSVLADSPVGTCLAFYPQDGRMAFDYYARQAPASLRARLRPVLPTAPLAQVRPYVEEYTAPSAAHLRQIVTACPRLWLIASHTGQSSGPAVARANLLRYETLLTALSSDYPSQRAKGFGYAPVVETTLFFRGAER